MKQAPLETEDLPSVNRICHDNHCKSIHDYTSGKNKEEFQMKKFHIVLEFCMM
jgi:hypothetical protein